MIKNTLIFIFSMYVTLVHANTLNLVTLTSPGSQSDTASRFIAPFLEKELNVSTVIHNKPGANGLLGMQFTLDKTKNEQTLLVTGTSLAYVAKTVKQLTFDPIMDFEPLYGLSASNMIIVTGVNNNVNNLKELIALYKTKGKVYSGTTIPSAEIASGQLDVSLSIKSDIIKYKQLSDMLINLSSGIIDYTIIGSGNSAVQGMIDAGKLKIIAVLGDERIKASPDTKTIIEQGYTDIDGFSWTAFFIHKNVNDKEKQVLRNAIAKIINSTEMKKFEDLPGNPRISFKNQNEVRKYQLREASTIPMQ